MSYYPRIIITRSNPIDPDPRVEKAAAALTEAGYTVNLLGWDRSAALPRRETIAGAACIRLPIRAQFGHGLGNLGPALRWQWGLAGWLVRHRREYDIVHACDFDTVLPALLGKFLFGKRVVYDIFDFYADHLRATPGWAKSLIRGVDLWTIRCVDALIITDESRWAQVGGQLPQNRVVILNTPADLFKDFNHKVHKDAQSFSLCDPLCPLVPFRVSWLNLVYIGLLQIERGLLDVLALLSDHPNWHLDLAGFGGDEKQILALSEELPNVTWHGRIPYGRALELTAAADVVLALYDPTIDNHRYASPNKLYEAMMLGKPVIVAANTNIDRIVQVENCGLVVEYGNRHELAAALEGLQADRLLCQQIGQNARRAYEREYNWHQMKTRLLALYAQLH